MKKINPSKKSQSGHLKPSKNLEFDCVLRVRELSPGKKSFLPSIWDIVDQIDQETANEISDYLNSGFMLMCTMGFRKNPMTTDGLPGLYRNILTDGRWFWDHGLAYLVKHHRLKLPEKFIEWVRSNGPIDHERLEKNALSLIKLVEQKTQTDLYPNHPLSEP